MWAAESSSIWGVLWVLVGDAGANLLGGSSWILLGFEWVFLALSFPSLPAAAPRGSLRAALPRCFLRKLTKNTKGEKKPQTTKPLQMNLKSIKKKNKRVLK